MHVIVKVGRTFMRRSEGEKDGVRGLIKSDNILQLEEVPCNGFETFKQSDKC